MLCACNYLPEIYSSELIILLNWTSTWAWEQHYCMSWNQKTSNAVSRDFCWKFQTYFKPSSFSFPWWQFVEMWRKLDNVFKNPVKINNFPFFLINGFNRGMSKSILTPHAFCEKYPGNGVALYTMPRAALRENPALFIAIVLFRQCNIWQIYE